MVIQPASPILKKPGRVLSVDVLRGVVMFAMVFVNDAYDAAGTPWWFKHFKEDGNGMTFVDLVYPAFLFIVGLSIPLAVQSRRDRGDSWVKIYCHVLLRTFGLLAIGVLMVEDPGDKQIGWPPGLWSTLMFSAVILAFHSFGFVRPALRYMCIALRAVGGLSLIFLAIKFRDQSGGHLQPSWWGILGEIGWAYFVATTAYLLLRQEGQAALVGMVAVLMCVYFADHAGTFNALERIHFWAFGHKISPFSVIGFGDHFGSYPSLVMAGVVIGSMLLPSAETQTPGSKIRFGAVFAVLLMLGALFTYSTFGINKDNATPTWALLAAAFATLLWIIFYAVIDVVGWRWWSLPLAWAGANALLIYILSEGCAVVSEHFVHWNWYDNLSDSYPHSIYHKLLTAGALTFIGGGLGRIGFKLKL